MTTTTSKLKNNAFNSSKDDKKTNNSIKSKESKELEIKESKSIETESDSKKSDKKQPKPVVTPPTTPTTPDPVVTPPTTPTTPDPVVTPPTTPTTPTPIVAPQVSGNYKFSNDSSVAVFDVMNGQAGVYVQNMNTGIVTPVVEFYNTSIQYESRISGNGRYVVFNSQDSTLVANDTNGTADVFMKDLQTGAITLISSDSNGVIGNGESSYASISADGKYVAFQSLANNFVAGDSNNTYDVYLKNTQTGETTRVSVYSTGEQSNIYSMRPFISQDGKSIVIQGFDNDLNPNTVNLSPAQFGQQQALSQSVLVESNASTLLNLNNPLAIVS